MCGRFVLIQKIETLEKRFNAIADKGVELIPSYNIGIGDNSVIITNDEKPKIREAVFGFTPHWAKKQMYLFNARSEGDRNKENDPNYRGAKEIINKPAFRKAIRTGRCLIPADAFIEGTTAEGLSKPYLVFLRNKVRPFAFAGIYNDWTNPDTGTVTTGFSIITTVPNKLLQIIPHHRSPVILPAYAEKKWLDNSAYLNEITDLLQPYDFNLMNAYPISDKVKNQKNKGRELIEPNGNSLISGNDLIVTDKIVNQGFGRKNRHF
jgi:putative SOS response-associated peptidase YedK